MQFAKSANRKFSKLEIQPIRTLHKDPSLGYSQADLPDLITALLQIDIAKPWRNQYPTSIADHPGSLIFRLQKKFSRSFSTTDGRTDNLRTTDGYARRCTVIVVVWYGILGCGESPIGDSKDTKTDGRRYSFCIAWGLILSNPILRTFLW